MWEEAVKLHNIPYCNLHVRDGVCVCVVLTIILGYIVRFEKNVIDVKKLCYRC